MQNSHREDQELIHSQMIMGFVVNKMVPGQVFLLVLRFFLPVPYHQYYILIRLSIVDAV